MTPGNPRFKPGDRVVWLPFCEDDPDKAVGGRIVEPRDDLCGYDFDVHLDGDDHGPTSVYDRELRPEPVENLDADAVLLHRIKQLRPDGRLALRGQGADQYQWADAGHLLRYLLRGEAQ